MAKIKIVKEEWLKAIAARCGMEMLVATDLKIHRHTVAKYRKLIPWIDRAFLDQRFLVCDLSEYNLHKRAADDPKVAMYLLDRLGKDRGYGKELKIETTDKPGVMHLHFPDDGRDKPDPSNPVKPTEPPTEPPPIGES